MVAIVVEFSGTLGDHLGGRLGGLLQRLGGNHNSRCSRIGCGRHYRATGTRNGRGIRGTWSGYAAARDLARNENSAAGFSEGFVTGLLGWEWRQTVDRFARTYLVTNQWDEAIDDIRVKYYNGGLKAGYSAAAALVPAVRKAYLTKLRRSVGAHNPAGWSAVSDDWSEQMRARLVQTSYVIDLASAGLRYEIIKPT